MRKMASFLFSWRKKQDAAHKQETVGGSQSELEPGVEADCCTPVPAPQDGRNFVSPAACAPAGDSCGPVSPLAVDAYGGEVAVTYESMNNKKQKHFTQIYVNPEYMPTVCLDAKPNNPDYLKIKHELINNAYHALVPYVDFVMSLKGMEDREDLRRALEILLKRFINRYWDMPASKDSHHAYPWGFLLHCIDVGCAEAEKATAWIPMAEHGIDEIKHARYLGMVVFLQFVGGLFHDAHKILQVDMTAIMDGYAVTFSPLRNNGNVLDFKLVYPERLEGWGDPYPNPGKLNAVEFLGLFPKELRDYVPTDYFLKVLFALFDLEGSDSDRDSAKRDHENAGRATLEKMILDQVRAYFTSDKAATRPENNVFKVNDDWVAVVSTQFLMKVRPMEGRVYTKDGVKNYLLREEALAGTASKFEAALLYRFKLPNGVEEVSKSKNKIAFVRASYLLQVYPELFNTIGQVYFDESDREAVTSLCPDAASFLQDVNKKITEQPVGKRAEAVPATPEPAKVGDAETNNAVPSAGSEEAFGLPEKGEELAPEEEQNAQPLEGGSLLVLEQGANIPADADTNAAEARRASPESTELSVSNTPPGAAKPKPRAQPMRKWSKQLFYLLDNYTSLDSCPETGWLYMGIYSVYVRIPHFYKKMTNEALLEQPDWRTVAESMCRRLGEEGLLKLEPITGQIFFTSAGGVDEATSKGNFFALDLPQEIKKKLSKKIVEAVPLPRQENDAYPQ